MYKGVYCSAAPLAFPFIFLPKQGKQIEEMKSKGRLSIFMTIPRERGFDITAAIERGRRPSRSKLGSGRT
ncbi:hypothetical protein XENTR_v10017540 [Xenopus tropicalis]|nr:hypothetical protein XENTR_v10017540 [Xenopus tropicalis]